MSKTDKSRTSNYLAMNALIICEDIAFAAKAEATLQRVGCRDNVVVQWVVKWWPINVLTEFAEKTLIETSEAHLIVLPARYAQSPPPALLDWLRAWAERRKIPEAGLGFIRESDTVDLPLPVCNQLFRFLREHRLSLIIDEDLAKKNEAGVFARSSEPPTSDNIPSYRHMGINE